VIDGQQFHESVAKSLYLIQKQLYQKYVNWAYYILPINIKINHYYILLFKKKDIYYIGYGSGQTYAQK
jgi:hypothetical protein